MATARKSAAIPSTVPATAAKKEPATKTAAVKRGGVALMCGITIPAAIKMPGLPKHDAQVGDLMYELQKERQALNKLVDLYAKLESECRERLINNLPKSESSGVSGKVARTFVEDKEIVRVVDWDAFHEWLVTEQKKDKGAWAMLQKRVNDSTVLEVLKARRAKNPKAKIPGVEYGKVPVVRLHKL